MTWGIFKKDSVSEAYCKMKSEELKGKQHKLDVNKNGKVDGDDLAKLRTKKEEVENVEEGWDDMLKYVKDKNGPQPNGGSGKKQGTRYGGGKQKEDESEKRKEKNESINLDIFSESEIDHLIAEALKVSDGAGKWISDFTKSDDPRFSGDSKEQRKKRALAAFYAAQKNESVDYDSFLEEEADLVKTGAKEIKHANVKDKDDEKDTMEPRAKGERDFLDQLSVQTTDDPAANGHTTGANKLSAASQPRGQGAGKYDGDSKVGIKKEDTSEEASSEEQSNADYISEKRASKKGFASFKAEKAGKEGC